MSCPDPWLISEPIEATEMMAKPAELDGDFAENSIKIAALLAWFDKDSDHAAFSQELGCFGSYQPT